MTKQESKKALREIIKLTTRAQEIDREVSSAKIKLQKLEKEQDEIYEKLARFSDPNKPDVTDTDDEPTESYEAPVTHTLAV
ncbi:hypothetical protein [Campylobacter showae]|uniref:hypothetical protein n=1 Tax=Campylobacter showae TaxID=204 RepID=UPI0028D0EFB6|nr:hypothetical protein [uncultured Campylobacter sp.]